MASSPLPRIEKVLLRLEEKMDDLTIDVTTLKERMSDYGEVKKDIEGLKRFRGWVWGLVGAGGLGTGGMAGLMKVFGGGH